MIFAGTSGMFCWDRRSDVLASVTACGDQQDKKLQPPMIFAGTIHDDTATRDEGGGRVFAASIIIFATLDVEDAMVTGSSSMRSCNHWKARQVLPAS